MQRSTGRDNPKNTAGMRLWIFLASLLVIFVTLILPTYWTGIFSVQSFRTTTHASPIALDPLNVPPMALGPPSPDESASIAGRVMDPQRRGIANATVCAVRWAEGVDDRPCTMTDPDGAYELVLPPGPYRAEAGAPEYLAGVHHVSGDRRHVFWLTFGERKTDIDIVLWPGGVPVRGIVVDASGGSIEGARVHANNEGGTPFSGHIGSAARALDVTDEKGRFELWVRAARTSIYAEARGYVGGQVSGTAPAEELEIRLLPESILVGSVVDAITKTPVENAEVRLDFTVHAKTGSDGGFVIRELPPGRYKPEATSELGKGMARESVVLGLGETSHEVLIELEPAVSVEGRVVVAGTNQPCLPSRVTLDFRQVDADDEGTVHIPGLHAGTYVVGVWCEAHVSPDYPSVVVLDKSISGIRWEVMPGLSVHGRVTTPVGDPVRDVFVFTSARAASPKDRTFPTTAGRTDDDGRFSILGLLPGRYRLIPGAAGYHRPAVLPEVEIKSRDIDGVTIEVTPDIDVSGPKREERSATMRGRVMLDGIPASDVLVRLELEKADRDGLGIHRESNTLTTLTTDAGEFEINRLLAGSYRITAVHRDVPEIKRGGIHAGTYVTLELVQPGSLAGKVTFGNETLHEFSVTAADKVQSIWVREAFFAKTGEWALYDVAPGTYDITITAREGEGTLTAVAVTSNSHVGGLLVEVRRR